jgi:protein YibB
MSTTERSEPAPVPPRRPRLPESLATFCTLAAGRPLATADPLESVIVTAFLDIGRDAWKESAAKASRHRRSTALYLERFGYLARLKNPMAVFVEPSLAENALAARRAHGLEDRTAIVIIDRPFAREPLASLVGEIEARMTPRLHSWVLHPDAPEYREPRYVLVNALKSAFVNAAVDLGIIAAAQTAWIDFGYCYDDARFDPTKPWRFDADGRMNLFYMNALDNPPLLSVVRSGNVYFQGCHLVGPTPSWRPFAGEIADALDALLACDLIDDDQTMMLMAWRRDPARYRIHVVPPPDWRVVFRRFNAETPLQPAVVAALRAHSESALREELRIAMKRWEWRVKRWRRVIGMH